MAAGLPKMLIEIQKTLKGKRKNEEGIILISFFLLIVVLLTGVGGFYMYAYADYAATLRSSFQMQAFQAAEAGIDQKLRELESGNMSATVNGSLVTDQYTATYTVDCAPCTGSTSEVITSTGTVTYNGTVYSKTITVTMQKSSPYVAPAVVGSNGPVTLIGDVTVDGREHDADGNLTGGAGIPGISTESGSITQGSDTYIGGNGIAPANPANPASYELNAEALPTTPEGILGVSSGDLDAYKTSSMPSLPFTNQIVYLTDSVNKNVDLTGSSGVLIVHNDAGKATLKKLEGTFKGIIIVDEVKKFSDDTTIIGALVFLTNESKSIDKEKVKDKKGVTKILYSPTAIAESSPIASYTVSTWQDSQNDYVS